MISFSRPVMVTWPLCADARGVAGIEPAVPGYHRGGRLGIVPVAQHVARSLDQQRILFADAYPYAFQRLADGGGSIVLDAVDAHHRTGLGHAVTLHQGQAERDEQARHLGRQRGAAADGQPQPPAEPVHHLVRDQFS